MNSLLDILNEIRPEHDFSTSLDFIENGMLDSFDLMMLVSALDKRYSLSIQGIDIVPENFCNLGAISQLLLKYGVKP